MTNSAPSPLWDVSQVASYLGKSNRWVWTALAIQPDVPGSIPHHRVGKSPRFDPSEIVGWVQAGCPSAASYRECTVDTRHQHDTLIMKRKTQEPKKEQALGNHS